MAPFGENRRQTYRYTQSNWKILNEGQWPPSTPAGELIELQWELTTQNNQALVQFLDCAGQDIRSLFQTDNFNPNYLSDDLKFVYDNISSANILIFLVNMKDLLATPDYVNELMDLDQMFHTLNQRNDIPRKMAVVFSQFDKYKPEVDQRFNGDFLEYLRHYIPLLHGQYIRNRNFEIIPVAAVNDTRDVVENGEVKQYPVPGFSSYNLESLIHWIADSVEELAPIIQQMPMMLEPPCLPPEEEITVPHPEQLKPMPQYTYEQLTAPYNRMTVSYILAYCLLFFIPAIVPVIVNVFGHDVENASWFGVIAAAFILLLTGLFYEIRLLYRCWDVIQDGYAATTPDRAVQFLYYPYLLFIPIVNIYWLSVCMYGLSKCLNNYIYRYQLDVRPCSATAMAFTCIAYNIPFLNLVLPIFILPFSMYSVMRTARDIQMINMRVAYDQVPHAEQLKPMTQYTSDQLTLPCSWMIINYVIAYCILFSIPVVKAYIDNNYLYQNSDAPCLALFLISCIFLLIGLFYEMRFLYRCWDVIQDGYAWVTPNKAIQFLYFPILLFIPIVNLYWLYVCLFGLNKCLNEYIYRYELNVSSCPTAAMTLTCIAYSIPFLNLVLPILFLPLAMISVMRTARDIQMIKMQLINS